MEKLQQKQTEALNAAREKFVKLLEAEKLAVMKAGDLPEAVKIDNAIKALKNPTAAIAAGVSPAVKNKEKATAPIANAKEIKKLDGYARVLPDCITQANDLKKKHYAAGGSEWNLATKELLLGQYNRMISTLRKIHAKIKKDKKLQQKYAGALSTFAGQLRNHGASFLGSAWMRSSSDPQKIEADVRRLRKKISGFPTGMGGAERRKMKYKRPR